MSASNYTEAEWMKYAFTAESMGTRPTAWYAALHDGDPGEAGTADEISGSSYARQSVTFTRTNNEVDNDSAVTFPTVTSAGYDVTHVSIWDNVSAGNCLFVGALEVPKSLDVGEAASFAAGELIISVD